MKSDAFAMCGWRICLLAAGSLLAGPLGIAAGVVVSGSTRTTTVTLGSTAR